jgi:hypothetical protein
MSTQSEIMEAMGCRTIYTKHVVAHGVELIIQLSMPCESDAGEVYAVQVHGKREELTKPPRYVHTEPHGFHTLEDALSGVATVVNEAVELAQSTAPAKPWTKPDEVEYRYKAVSIQQMQMEI